MNRETMHHAFHRQPTQRMKRQRRRYDFGPLGMLTIEQASEACGVKPSTLYSRMSKGLPLSDLISPYMRSQAQRVTVRHDSYRAGPGSQYGLALGVWLFRNYGMNPPTAGQVKDDTGCSRAQSYRIVRAYKDAIGLP